MAPISQRSLYISGQAASTIASHSVGHRSSGQRRVGEDDVGGFLNANEGYPHSVRLQDAADRVHSRSLRLCLALIDLYAQVLSYRFFGSRTSAACCSVSAVVYLLQSTCYILPVTVCYSLPATVYLLQTTCQTLPAIVCYSLPATVYLLRRPP